MKRLEDIIAGGSACLDGRDFSRLAAFMTAEQIDAAGMSFKTPEARAEHSPVSFTEDNVLTCLERDIEFAFDKALDKRGISASLMVYVVAMWVAVLEADVGKSPVDDYAQYGLPYLKAVAVHFGFDNPIGDDEGTEFTYSEYADYNDYDYWSDSSTDEED